MTHACAPVERDTSVCIEEVRNEYAEMPGLCLTLPQARRLFGLDDDWTMARVLATLVDTGFLKLTRGGMYVRADAR